MHTEGVTLVEAGLLALDKQQGEHSAKQFSYATRVSTVLRHYGALKLENPELVKVPPQIPGHSLFIEVYRMHQYLLLVPSRITRIIYSTMAATIGNDDYKCIYIFCHNSVCSDVE